MTCLSGRSVKSDEHSTPAARHSCGPWSAHRSRGGGKMFISAANGWHKFARVWVRMAGSREDVPQGIANVRLMTAAPDMKATLRHIRDVLADRMDCDDGIPSWEMNLVTEIDEVLRKAGA